MLFLEKVVSCEKSYLSCTLSGEKKGGGGILSQHVNSYKRFSILKSALLELQAQVPYWSLVSMTVLQDLVKAHMGFPGCLDGKESACNMGDPGLILLLSRSGEGNSYPLQISCLENSMDREASWATVHRITKSWTQ